MSKKMQTKIFRLLSALMIVALSLPVNPAPVYAAAPAALEVSHAAAPPAAAAGLADEAAERAAAQRHAEAAAKQYERATAGVAKPNPIVVTLGRVRATVERTADVPMEPPKKVRGSAKSDASAPEGLSSPS